MGLGGGNRVSKVLKKCEEVTDNNEAKVSVFCRDHSPMSNFVSKCHESKTAESRTTSFVHLYVKVIFSSFREILSSHHP